MCTSPDANRPPYRAHNEGVPENPYHRIPYSTWPRFHSHPDRLAAVATLFGMQPAPVRSCRVLEIGCGNGGNVIPLAYYLPESRFTGVDLASRAVDAGRGVIEALGLQNIELHAADLRSIDKSYGSFDYIIAHGVYSWVPGEVRDALLAVAAARLAPQGVAFVSYNALPGRRVRDSLRDMMLHHTRGVADPHERVVKGRWLLEWLKEAHIVTEAWNALIDAEIDTLLRCPPNSMAHDDLNPYNESFYLHEFAAAAAAHGLQYLGDASNRMFDIRGKLGWFEGSAVERAQYLDYAYMRTFAETLLCRAETALNRDVNPRLLESMSFSAPVRRVEDEIEGYNGIRLTARQPAVEPIAMALGESYPLPLTFRELLPLAESDESLLNILNFMVRATFVQFHVHDFACARSPSERPTANRLARYQARDSNRVTNVRHALVELDEPGRQLLLLLDGTRTVDELAHDLAQQPGLPPTSELVHVIPVRLAWMAKMGVLEK